MSTSHEALIERLSSGPGDPRAKYSRERRHFWDDYASTANKWVPLRSAYRRRLSALFQLSIPPGMRVLEIGCGEGDLLAELRPCDGYGVDFCAASVERAKVKYPQLRFDVADANDLHIEGTFDVIVCSDLVNDLWDVQETLERIGVHCHRGTRIWLNCYSHLWAGPRKIAEILGLAKPQLIQNWLTVEDISNLLQLAGFEMLRASPEIMCPVRIPLIDTLCNRYLVKFWPFRELAITNVIAARPDPALHPVPAPVVTVVVPARNEAGNIPAILDRVPQLGAGTELIFVEGNSTDGTYARIQAEIAARPGCEAKLFRQTGKGKGDAVRLGFEHATGELLMILDADLTVPPEELPKFYNAWFSGKGDFVNGVRLIYPMEDKAMQFLNLLGNKFFSMTFSFLLGQSVKDTLCGTKVLSKSDYRVIAANRAYFGEIDPFGDFDLLFGAARFSLKIVDLPVRYRERTYGETNIQRWRHGLLLLRMAFLASRRIRFV